MKNAVSIIVVMLGLPLFAGRVHAAETVTTFSVGATVTDACSVSASDLAFGNIDPLVNATSATDATTAIAVTCANGTVYDIALDSGTGSGTTTARAMTNGVASLNYALYSDASRTLNWGNTTGADTVADTGTGAAQTLTVYGRVPPGQQSAPTGTYADTITVIITY